MQIILVSGRLKTAKTLTIMPRHVLWLAFAFIGLVLATSAAFSWLSVRLRLPLVQELVLSLQQRETQQTQEFVHNNLRLLATRLGELQAQVVQLDTLGERLQAISGLRKEMSKEAPKEAARPVGQGGPLIEVPMSADELQKEIDRLGSVVDTQADDLTVLEARLLEKRVRDRLLPTTLPVKSAVFGSGFGHRADPIAGVRAMHEGIDFIAETGTPVAAAAAGVVVRAELHPEFGNLVEIDHGDGLISRYAHMSTLLVKPGQLLRRGDGLGAVGSTGRSTGPHLHFEVRMLGVAQNPAMFLKQGKDYALAKRR